MFNLEPPYGKIWKILAIKFIEKIKTINNKISFWFFNKYIIPNIKSKIEIVIEKFKAPRSNLFEGAKILKVEK